MVPQWLRVGLQNPEIPLYLYFVAVGLFTPAEQNFIYHRSCLYFYDSEDICNQIDSARELRQEEQVLQDSFSHFLIYLQIASLLPTVFVATIYGSWCDDFSHRLPMAIAHLGYMLTTLIYLLVSLAPVKAINPEYLGFVSIFQGLGGNSVTVATVALSHAARRTSPNFLMIRFGIIEMCMTLGEMSGYILTAFIFKDGKNYFNRFLIQMAINAFAICYSFTMMPKLHKDKKVTDVFKIQPPLRRLVKAGKIVFKRPDHRHPEHQKKMIVALFLFGTTAGLTGNKALNQITYEFMTHDPITFTFDPFQYSIYQAIFMASITIGLIVILPLFRSSLWPRVFPLSDAAIGLISMISKIAALFVLSLGGFFPTASPWIYCIVVSMASFIYIALRSALSKISETSERGQVFAISGILQTCFTLLATVTYNFFYRFLVSSTPDSSPLHLWIHGYIFQFIALISIAITIPYVWLGFKKIETWSFYSSNKI